ncbi:MAG TPA: ribonuclease P protein component [Bacteroidota bacterium]|nr:ribonuclease P protein component [Bacteroidota bacterium]
MRNALPKSDILRGKKIFTVVFQHGRRIEGKFIRCYLCPHPVIPADEPFRWQVGFAVAGKVRRAVDRNRMKRLLRESYRCQKDLFSAATASARTSLAIVFLFSVPTHHRRELPTFQQVADDMKSILIRASARGAA